MSAYSIPLTPRRWFSASAGRPTRSSTPITRASATTVRSAPSAGSPNCSVDAADEAVKENPNVNDNETQAAPTDCCECGCGQPVPTGSRFTVEHCPSPVWISGLDADFLFIDPACRAWRVEDLPEPRRREVLDAVARSRNHEVLPSAARLEAVSRHLSGCPHLRDMPPDRRTAVLVATAMAFDAPDLQPAVAYWFDKGKSMRDHLQESLTRAERTIAALKVFNYQRVAREMLRLFTLGMTKRRRPRSTRKKVPKETNL
jgi:hypothetical protein